MASNTSSQNISNKAGKVTGQAQAKKDELMDRAGQATGQAQTGEQVMHMAQGAADAVKNTLGGCRTLLPTLPLLTTPTPCLRIDIINVLQFFLS
ncbi:hypothetical protein AQUCO_10300008v1 [Aquilegia coerulea]|uniref:Uncharacterized protein n=1 Tax=Aquilegia coerulea TaxID=218851 RepID=A0A2G5C540_AQUCA|nr:hypothetical protein AQUCO_10300008v1 [Aquilegia coerulea]